MEGLPALAAAARAGDSAADGAAAAAAERAQQGLRPLLQQAGGAVQAAREAAAAVGGKLALAEDGPVPSLAAAQVSVAMRAGLLVPCEQAQAPAHVLEVLGETLAELSLAVPGFCEWSCRHHGHLAQRSTACQAQQLVPTTQGNGSDATRLLALPCHGPLQAAYVAYKALRQALSCEALAAVVSLRLQEGPPADPSTAVAAPTASASEPAAGEVASDLVARSGK